METITEENSFWLAYRHEGQTIRLNLVGFGSFPEIQNDPRYEEFCTIFKTLAMKYFKLEEIE